MRRLTMLALGLALVAGVTAWPARAAQTICVGKGPGCYSQLQPAFDAAHDGDTITIAPGTYAGGLSLVKSVIVVGAGAGRTIIKGGGPVLTIGVRGDPNSDALTVSISGVTITGGVATTTQTPDGPFTFIAEGGGVMIPHGDTIGATVTIRDSVITGNRATPEENITFPDTECPDGVSCPYGEADGGGIADVGRLTLVRTVVSDNVAGGGPSSNASGGGIWTSSHGGPAALTLIDSTVSGNRAFAAAPSGRFAEGGGIDVQDGEQLSIQNSSIDGNRASVSGTYPEGVEMFANSGGLHIGGSGAATIKNTTFEKNVASADDPAGFPGAADGALSDGFSDCACGQTLVLHDSVVRDNRVRVDRLSSDNGQSGPLLEIDGQADVRNLTVENNGIVVKGRGSAFALGTFLTIDTDSSPIVMRDSTIRNNVVMALSSHGTAQLQGAGLTNAGPLELHDVVIRNNLGVAHGTDGFAQGGGIWNGQPFGSDGAPVPALTVDGSRITNNVLTGSPGIDLAGGGIFSDSFPVTLTNTLVVHNTPDQCAGC